MFKEQRMAWQVGVLGSLTAVSAPRDALAQHAHGSAPEHGTAETAHAGMDQHAHAGMDHAKLMRGPLGISRSRAGSGTSWLPDSSPMYGVMAPLGEGGFMLHENVFVGYDSFGGDRGSSKLVSMNSVMGMAWHPLGPGELMGRVMLSAEAATVGKRGYPLILQTGETANGEPLHDRQHPHDLFMEVAAFYTLPVASSWGVELYVAPAGEPALGPTAYPHRISAISDPLAPIGHHWQDSTHISFGVITLGVFTRQVKVEGSWFNGREPDENRWDLDLRVPDSYSGRVSWNAGANWNLQGSYGYLASPEPNDTSLSLQRATASATYNLPLADQANWSTTFVFGENMPSHGPATPSLLLESDWNANGHHVVFGRVEYVRKTSHDLVLSGTSEDETYDVGLAGVGYAYHLGPFASLSPGLGVRGSAGLVDSALEETYGARVPLGVMLFAQLRPAEMGQ